MRRSLLAALAAALALPAAAAGGGWATAGVAPLPDGSDTWTPTLTILQHGRTPLDGLAPSIQVTNGATGETLTFPAAPTGQPGEYRAVVRFPDAGTWSYVVDDGFSQRHTFAPVRIGVPAAETGPAGGGFPVLWGGLALVAVLLAATAAALALRRRGHPPRPAAASR